VLGEGNIVSNIKKENKTSQFICVWFCSLSLPSKRTKQETTTDQETQCQIDFKVQIVELKHSLCQFLAM
jgi:hypothetical protein